MSHKLILICFLSLIFSLSSLSCSQQNNTANSTCRYPFPHAVNYAYGIKPSVSQTTMNTAVQSAYLDWLSRYVTTEGTPAGAYRVHRASAYNYDTVSEGIGWGMLITVMMENQDNQTQRYFNGLWKYYQHYKNSSGLMAWQIDRYGNISGEGAATDADENAAMALFFADKQWGSQGEINYLSAARTLLSAIYSFEVEAGTYVLKPGDQWGGTSATNPSYYDLAFYRSWKNISASWEAVLNKSLNILDVFYAAYSTGLFPDWTTSSGGASGLLSFNYTYDACRVPLKLCLDYIWNGESKKYLTKLNAWIINKTAANPAGIVDGYSLTGNTLGQYNNASFVGPFCLAAMASEEYRSWLNTSYQHLATEETGGAWGYYPDTLRLLSLLIVSGNFPNL